VSVPVELDALRSRIDEHGPVAYLVTVNEAGTPHVVSVVVGWDDGRLVVPTGRRTRANLEREPRATLLWPMGPDPAYSLIVDGTATVSTEEAGEARIEPGSAVLHRVVGAPGDGPECLPVGDRGVDS